MIFVKERNLIVAYDGEAKAGAWDFTTGNFIGKKGKPVKSVPSCFTFDSLARDAFNNSEINLSYVIREFRDWSTNGWRNYTPERGARLECLISVGLFPNRFEDLDSTIPLTKDVVNFCKENHNNYYSDWHVRDYCAKKKYASYLENKPEWARRTFFCCYKDLPIDYLKAMINRMMLEHVDSFYKDYSGSFILLIKNYYNMSMELYGKVEVPHNILTQYGILRYLVEENKKAHYDEHLKANNDKPWLYYENDNYIVRPLFTREAFHKEAEAQDNCVERLYMEKVYNGATHVVVIRHKSEPEKSYITCEVDKTGEIVQYLLRFNRRPTNDKDRNFRREYQLYLLDNIPEKE